MYYALLHTSNNTLYTPLQTQCIYTLILWATNDSDVISAHLGYRLSYHDDDAIMPFLGYHDDGVIMPSWAYRMEQDGSYRSVILPVPKPWLLICRVYCHIRLN